MFGENKSKKETVPEEELAQVKMTKQLDSISSVLDKLLQAVKDLNTYKAASARRTITILPGDSKIFSPMGAQLRRYGNIQFYGRKNTVCLYRNNGMVIFMRRQSFPYPRTGIRCTPRSYQGIEGS